MTETRSVPSLIGMVHLPALPGSPRFEGSMDRVVEHAVADATTLEAAGFDAVMVENFGDAPFYADAVPPVTVAAMGLVVDRITQSVGVEIGVNVLRNDALAALSIAAVTGATMIRVNVLAGTMYTDQGPISGRAAEVGRLRSQLGTDVAILADVFVKHAVPPPGSAPDLMAAELWERAGADGIVVSGTGTGAPIDLAQVGDVRRAIPDAPIVVGSGATAETLTQLAAVADSVIVGSSLKSGLGAAVDGHRAAAFVTAARSAGF